MTALSEVDLGVVLVVGGCGYLGSRLVRLLSEQSVCSAVHVFSRNPIQNLHPGATYHTGDIATEQHVSSLLDVIKPCVIFHTASPKYTASAKILRHTNIDGTRVLLREAAKSTSVKAFVYTGTDSALVQAPGTVLKEETAELYNESSSEANEYAKSKAVADAQVRAANSPELRTAVIRIPGLYGEDDNNCVGSLLKTIKKNQHNVQVGNNKNRFEFVYVENACEAHILAAEKLVMAAEAPKTSESRAEESKVDGEAFFVSDGVSMPYFDFARKIYAFAGHPVKEIKVMPYNMVLAFAVVSEWVFWIFTFGTKTPDVRKLGIEYLAGGSEWDISKAKKRLGYKPVSNQDAVLERVAQVEARRVGV